MTHYPPAALEGVSKAFNAQAQIATRVTPLVDAEIVTLVLQEGTHAVVVTLMPEGTHNVMDVGTPGYKTRCDMNLLCQEIAHQWRLVHFPPLAAVNAAVDCIREALL